MLNIMHYKINTNSQYCSTRCALYFFCQVTRVWLSCTSNLNRSNLLEVGNLAKKGLGNGEIVLSRIVLAG
jgi:hypothetical protein